LGAYTFDARATAVREAQAESGGRDAREIRLTGLLGGTAEELETALDAIVAAAGDGDVETALSLRTGRRLVVRRVGFTREIARDERTATFVLDLEARDPYESSESVHSHAWEVTASGNTLNVASAGNVYARPVITLVASGDVVAPAFSVGERTLTYDGIVPDGESLVLNGETGRVWLLGEDVTPYTSGVFPRIGPGATILTYTDDALSSHTAEVTVDFRDRWW
jgi:hypothetical protein